MFLRGIIIIKMVLKFEKEEETKFWVIQVNQTSVMKQEKKKNSDFSKLKPSSSIKQTGFLPLLSSISQTSNWLKLHT